MAIATAMDNQKSHATALVALVGVALISVACSSNSATPGVANLGSNSTTTTLSVTNSPTPFAGPQAEYQYALSYAACMRAHGVASFPDPTKSAHGFSFDSGADSRSPHFQSANTACKHLLPDNGGGPTPAELATETQRLLEFSACMRAHGEPGFPDPIIDPHQIGFRVTGLKPNSPQFQTARKRCQNLLPGGPG